VPDLLTLGTCCQNTFTSIHILEASGGGRGGRGGGRSLQLVCRSRQKRHGHRAVPREECGRGCQLDGCGAGPAGVRQRNPVDPLPVGGVCGECVGVLQRGDRSRVHVLLPAVRSAVSNVMCAMLIKCYFV